MTRLTLATLLLFMLGAEVLASAAEGPVYQLRTYYVAPGKLSVLVDRFRAHNLPIFDRNGIKLEGAWTPVEPGEEGERLVYLVSFPSREAAKKAWQGFSNDEEWKRVFAAEKEARGKVVTKAETVYLSPTDYSPALATSTGDGTKIYELRTYTASPGKMANLNARFRNHTLELFTKHGMTNLTYTEPMVGETGAGETLVYMLSFPDREAASRAWEAFRSDPDWLKARSESEADGVKLAAAVKSVFLKPLDFSPLK